MKNNSRQSFDKSVLTIPEPNGYESKIIYKCRVHTAHGKTEKEAEDNLWEYLVDEVGI